MFKIIAWLVCSTLLTFFACDIWLRPGTQWYSILVPTFAVILLLAGVIKILTPRTSLGTWILIAQATSLGLLAAFLLVVSALVVIRSRPLNLFSEIMTGINIAAIALSVYGSTYLVRLAAKDMNLDSKLVAQCFVIQEVMFVPIFVFLLLAPRW